MGQYFTTAEQQGVDNNIGQQTNRSDAGQQTNRSDAASLYSTTLNPLRTYDCLLNRPHDVILHDGRYIITDTYGGRIVALDATNGESSVLYKAEISDLPFRPFSIVALSDTESSFLITDLKHKKRKGRVFKLEGNVLTPFSSSQEHFCAPTGITFNRTRDKVYIVESIDHCILEFEKDGNYLGARGVNNLIDPWFIACNSREEIYVTDKEGIKVFDQNWEYLNSVTINTLGKTWCYRGIAIDRDDIIFITARSRDSFLLITHETVAVIDATHELVKEYTGGIYYHNYLRGVCIDYERNRVVVVNGEKHIISTYIHH